MKRKIYNSLPSVFIALTALAVTVSCKKKEEKADIYIAPVEEKAVDDKPKISGDETISADIEWVGYNCEIKRMHEENSIITDTDGNKYYNNTVNITITHGDATVFNRTFSESDFSAYIDNEYLKPSERILVGIAYNKLIDGNATFMATIGNPDPDSDVFMSVQISIDKNGGMSMKSMKSLNGDDEGSKIDSTSEASDVSELSDDFVGD